MCGVVSSVLLFVFVLFVRFCCCCFVDLLLCVMCCYVLLLSCCVLLLLLYFVVVVSCLSLSFGGGGGGCLWEWARFSLIRIRVPTSCKNSIQRSPLRSLLD